MDKHLKTEQDGRIIWLCMSDLVGTLIFTNLWYKILKKKNLINKKRKKKPQENEHTREENCFYLCFYNTSSPIKKTLGSADISSSIAVFKASRTVICKMSALQKKLDHDNVRNGAYKTSTDTT